VVGAARKALCQQDQVAKAAVEPERWQLSQPQQMELLGLQTRAAGEAAPRKQELRERGGRAW